MRWRSAAAAAAGTTMRRGGPPPEHATPGVGMSAEACDPAVSVTLHGDVASLHRTEVTLVPDVAEPFEQWAVAGAACVLTRLRETLAGDSPEPRRLVVAVQVPIEADPWRRAAVDALLAAVRGIVGSLTLEYRAALRINAIFAEDLARPDVQSALAFLGGPLAGFVAGATIDLREDG